MSQLNRKQVTAMPPGPGGWIMALSHRNRAPIWAVAVACCLSCLACNSATDVPIDEVDLRLSGVTLGTVEMGSGDFRRAFLEVRGHLAGQNQALAPHERVRLMLRTDSGDREELLVGPERCPDPYDCHRLTVVMDEGRDARMLEAPVATLGALLNLPRICSTATGECASAITSIAEVYVLQIDDVPRVIGALRWVPGVASIGRTVWGSPLAGPDPKAGIVTVVLLDEAPTIRGDGVVQGANRAEVFVESLDRTVHASITISP